MSKEDPSDYSHLWNDLPYEERRRMMPHAIMTHILHLEQAKAIAVRAHRRHMQELNDWINNLREDLRKERP
jgi:hypothetical protein